MHPAEDVFIGEERRRLVQELQASFLEVGGESRPRCHVLSGSQGVGKTRVVQELYRLLAAEHQNDNPYWPPEMLSAGGRESALHGRHVVYPRKPPVPVDADPTWLWWGVECDVGSSGSRILSLRNASEQLDQHSGAIRRRAKRRETAGRVGWGGIQAVAGLVLPDIAGLGTWLAESASEVTDRFRESAQAHQERKRGGRRVIDIDRHAWSADAENFSSKLATVVGPDMPLVLVLDNAHWADPGTVEVIDRVLRSDMPVLVVATAWPEELRAQAQAAAESEAQRDYSFGGWVSRSVATPSSRVRLHLLERLAGHDMNTLINVVARNTTATVRDHLLDRANGNPLFLRLLLESPMVTDAIQNMAIELGLRDLDKLPPDLHELLLRRWNGLSAEVRRALMVVSLQGIEFDRALATAAADGLGLEDLDSARESGWVQPVSDRLDRFTEPVQFDIAERERDESISESRQRSIATSLRAAIGSWMSEPSWTTTPDRERRHALEFVASEVSPTADPCVTAAACLQLSRLLADVDDWTRAHSLADRGLTLGVVDDDERRDQQLWLVKTLRRCGRAAEALTKGRHLLGEWEAAIGVEHLDVGALHLEVGHALLEHAGAPAAVEIFRSALLRLSRDGDFVETATLRRELAAGLLDAGEVDATANEVERLLEEIERHRETDTSVGFRELTVETLRLRVLVALEMGSFDDASTWQAKLVEELRLRHGRAAPATTSAVAEHVVLLAFAGVNNQATSLANSTRDALESVAHTARERARILHELAMAELLTGGGQPGIERLRVAAEEFRAVGGHDDPEALEAELVAALMEVLLGERHEVGEIARLAQRAHDSGDFSRSDLAAFDAIVLGVRHRLGEGSVKADDLERCLEEARFASVGGFIRAVTVVITGQVLIDQGEFDVARRAFDDANLWTGVGVLEPLLIALREIATVGPSAADAAAAQSMLGRVREIEVPLLRAAGLATVTKVCLSAGRYDDALAAAEEATQLADELFGDESLPGLSARLSTASCLARIGRHDAGLDLVGSVLDRADLLPGAVSRAVRLDAARVATRCGANDLAVAVLDSLLAAASGVLDFESELTLWRRASEILREAGEARRSVDLARQVVERERDNEDPAARRDAAFSLTRSLVADRSSDEALATIEPVVRELRQLAGLEADLAIALDLLAEAYEHVGRVDEAVDARVEAVEIRVATRRADHADTLTARRALGALLFRAGRFDEAAVQDRVVFEVRVAQSGLAGPVTVNAAGILAANLLRGDHPAEAIGVLEPSVTAARAESQRSPELAFALGWLAEAYEHVGRVDEAVDARVEAVEIRVATRRADHADTLTARRALGALLFRAGRFDEAAVQDRVVFEVRVAQSGLAGPVTVNAAGNLASCLLRGDHPAEAIGVLEPSVTAARAESQRSPELAFALGWLAEAYEHVGRVDEAVDAQVEAVEIRVAVSGVDHADTLTARRELGVLLFRAGRHDEAADQFRVVFEVWVAQSGLAGPVTLNAAGNLASCLLRGDHPAEAIGVLEPSVTAARAESQRSPELAFALGWLAEAYEHVGRVDEAVDARVEAVEIRVAVSGVDHADTLTARQELGVLLFRAGRFDEAADQFRVVFEVWVAQSGLAGPVTVNAAGILAANLLRGDHPAEAIGVLEPSVTAARAESQRSPELAFALGWLAEAYEHVGRVDEAVDAQVEAVEIRVAVSGVDHADTLTARRELGVLLFRAGRFDEAAVQDRVVFEVRVAQSGLAGPVTVNAAGNLAANLLRGDHPAEAIGVLEPSVTAARAESQRSPELAFALGWLAEAYEHVGRVDEAVDARVEAVEIRVAVSGVDHADTLTARRALGVLLFRAGRFDEAAVQYRVVFEVRVAQSGLAGPVTVNAAGNLAANLLRGDHPAEAIGVLEPSVTAARAESQRSPELAFALGWLAEAYEHVGRVDEAVDAQVEAVEIRVAVSGVDHADTLTARRALGALLFRAGRHDEAANDGG